MHILEKIVAHKRKEVAVRKELTSIKSMEDRMIFKRMRPSLSQNIKSDPLGIISEFKRRSPSKPEINLNAKVVDVVPYYDQAGVSGISILTDTLFFGGSDEDVQDGFSLVRTPILRKEFIIDEYQIIESKSIGASAILLITEILDKEQCKNFAALANSIGLEVVMEIHSEAQLEKFNEHVQVIGVNNRDLTKFVVDPQHSVRLYDSLPKDVCKISESGIHNPETISMLLDCGYDGFLIGERFMKTEDPGLACRNFMKQCLELVPKS